MVARGKSIRKFQQIIIFSKYFVMNNVVLFLYLSNHPRHGKSAMIDEKSISRRRNLWETRLAFLRPPIVLKCKVLK